jgi:AcrR family transcriptional regulator
MSVAAKRRRPRAGRTPGSPPNREAILEAARGYFSRHGYDRATIRGIAADAGVDPALVHHYFGTKDQLLVAALKLPVSPREVVPQLLAGDVNTLGERMLRKVLAVWGADLRAGGALLGLVRASLTHEDAAAMMREFFTREMIGRIAAALEVPQPRLRAALVASQMMGILMVRFIIRMEPLASADPETLIASYAPTIQRYLTGTLPGDEAASSSPPGPAAARRRHGKSRSAT